MVQTNRCDYQEYKTDDRRWGGIGHAGTGGMCCKYSLFAGGQIDVGTHAEQSDVNPLAASKASASSASVLSSWASISSSVASVSAASRANVDLLPNQERKKRYWPT